MNGGGARCGGFRRGRGGGGARVLYCVLMRSSVRERERPGKAGEAAARSAGGEQAAVGGRRRA
jgi:hypothetical protein